MRCEETGNTLLELMEEELPLARRAEVADHLEVCAVCAGEFSAYRDLLALVRADPVPEPSLRFWEEFHSSLKHRIEQGSLSDRRESASWLGGLRSWFAFPRPLLVGAAVAAVSILIVVRLPGPFSIQGDRQKAPAPMEQLTSREGETREGNRAPHTEAGKRELGDAVIVAGEVVDDASMLAAAIQRLPRVNEIADRIEAAWASQPGSDRSDWLVSLSDDEQQLLIDRLRGFRWPPS